MIFAWGDRSRYQSENIAMAYIKQTKKYPHDLAQWEDEQAYET